MANFDTHSLFAYSTIASVTSQTIFTVQTGDGAKFAVNQNITIWSAGTNPTKANAFIARTTGISTDTITIASTAQEGSTLQTISTGMQVANSISPKIFTDIENLLTNYTQGSVLFAGAGGTPTQNNAGFFWDNTNDVLNIKGATWDSWASLIINGGTSLFSDLRFSKATGVQYLSRFGSGDLDIQVAGKDCLYLLGSNGNVGVQTTTPSKQLHIIGDCQINDLATNPTMGYVFRTDGGELDLEFGGKGLYISGTPTVDSNGYPSGTLYRQIIMYNNGSIIQMFRGVIFLDDTWQAFACIDPSGLIWNTNNLNQQIKIPALSSPASTTATTGGTIAAGTYYYKVSSFDVFGNESMPSFEVQQTTTGTSSTVTINWVSSPGAVSYRIYKGTTTGGENVYFTSTTTSFTDTGTSGTAGSPSSSTPALNLFNINGNNYINSGNLGIGTVNPAYKLDVVGQINSSGIISGKSGVFNTISIGTTKNVTPGATPTIDWSVTNNYKLTLTASVTTLTLSNPVDGGVYKIVVKQPSTGGPYTITWPATVGWPGGTVPTLSTTANAVDIITLIYDADQTVYRSVATIGWAS